MSRFHRDYETRSTVDLKKTGAAKYMRHPTTSIWCMSYALDDDPVKVWTPGEGVPSEMIEAADLGYEAWAHNAAFEIDVERHVGPRYGLPQFRLSQQRCTMVGGYAMSLPGSLEMATPAVGLDLGKDMIGRRLMLQMAKPRGKIEYAKGFKEIPYTAVRTQEMDEDGWEAYATPDGRPVARVRWWNQPDKIERLKAYALIDTELERELERRLRPLKPSELALWHLDQTINNRGVFIDRDLCNAAKKIVERASDQLDAEMREATGFEVSACSNRNQLVTWLRAQGIDTDTLKRDAIDELLGSDLEAHIIATEARLAKGTAEEQELLLSFADTPAQRAARSRVVLELRRASARASVAKIDALLLGADHEDDRVRGLLQFHAASTGRWGGRRFQPQNLKRPDEADIPTLIDVVATGDFDYLAMMYDDPLSAVSDVLRGLIKAGPGKKIVAADLSNIEGRVLAWLAGEEWKLEAFRRYDRGEGPDLYIKSYAETFGVPLFDKKDPRRQVGKTMELAGGFQGAIGAYLAFLNEKTLAQMTALVRSAVDDEEWEKTARGYENRSLTVDQWTALTIVIARWRAKHAATKQLWYDIERAAVAAADEPGSTHSAANGKLVFRMAGSFLAMRLPSGRFLFYPNAKVQQVKTRWTDDDGQPVYKKALTYFSTIDPAKKGKIIDDPANTSRWARISSYGGMLTENATQAVARDIMAAAMPKLEAAGYPIILTVHDEIVCEPDADHGDAAGIEQALCDLPAWAEGLPVAAEGFEDERYRK